jgi:hypothetical protein
MEAQSCLERPALGNYYSVAGRFIFVESADEWCASLFERTFANWHVAPVAGVPNRIDCTIRARRVAMTPRVPEGLGGFEISGGGYCHTDGNTHYLEYTDALVVVDDKNPPTVEAWLGESLATVDTAIRTSIVFNVFGASLRRSGLLELHGGGVESPGGVGVLIVGPSGSGKSTLTTQLAAEGWHYLSDDTLLLYQNDDGIGASGLRRTFALTEETIAASEFQRLRVVNSSALPFNPSKRRFEPRDLFPGGFIEATTPAALFFPAITRERSSRTVRLSQFESMKRLLRVCPWACYDRPAAKDLLAVLTQLAKQCSAFDLLAGKDLLGDSKNTARLFSESIGGSLE